MIVILFGRVRNLVSIKTPMSEDAPRAGLAYRKDLTIQRGDL